MTVTTLSELNPDDAKTLAELYSKQSRRFSDMDSRLRSFTEDQTRQRLSTVLRGDPDVSCLLASRSRLQGGAVLQVVKYSEDSDMLALFPRVCGISSLLTLPASDDPERTTITQELLEAIELYWQQKRAGGGLLNWPSCDSLWLTPMLHQRGFVTYSVLAVRMADDLPADPPVSSNNLITRAAEPQDEDVVVQLIIEQMAFHEGLTPFDRVVPSTEVGARERLSRIWSGMSVSDGAPMVLVAEIEGQVVGMIECGLSDMRSTWSYLPPLQYGYINIAATSAAWRGKGVGSHLVRAALCELKLHHAEAFYTYYVPANPLSSRFWPNRGFQPLLITYQKRYAPDA